jgi:hypothetical protein
MVLIRSRVMYDAEFSADIPAEPSDSAIAGYMPGGDPAHPWATKPDWSKFKGRRKLPIFVRSNPGQSNAEDDAFKALRDLWELGASHCLVALDIETANDAAYVTEWGAILRHFGYRVLVYGSAGNVFKLPKLDGRWLAAPGKTFEDYPGDDVRIIQDTGAQPKYDRSLMRAFIAMHGEWWR